jgi:uncharacterized protein (TIGR03083 family)
MPLDERAAFQRAAAWFRSTVDRVGDRWDQPGLGEWTVRDLVGHTSRSLVTVETYLDAEPSEVTVGSAVAYYVAVRQASSGSAVAERGRQAGAAMGADPAGFLAALEERVLAKVAAADDAAYVASAAGGMRLIDYLPTRTFELVVHTADLAVALGVETSPPADAETSALRLAADLAREQGSGVDVLLALTGRRPLAPGFSLL